MVIDGDLAARARADDVSFLLALFVDLAGKPCAKLVPIRAGTRPRKPGGWEGKVKIAKDFDAPWA